MYTVVEGIQFSPHWVDGSRSSAGHCCLWPWGAIEGEFAVGAVAGGHPARLDVRQVAVSRFVDYE